MKYLSLIILAFCTFLSGYSQNSIEGILLDAETKEPIPYANIVIEGTYKGTATNYDGVFILKISDEQLNGKLLFSAIGYTDFQIEVKKHLNMEPKKFFMKPVSYQINDVTIEAKSLYYYGIIKKAVNNIEKNYYQKAFNYDIYYRNTQSVNAEVQKERQAAVRLYDAAGYQKASTFQVYKERAYKFLQVRRNFELNSLSDGTTQLDDLLEFDIVRIGNNVLLSDISEKDWEINLKQMTVVENDSVWVLHYECKQPNLGFTGDAYSTHYEGELYIKTKDYAVVKNVTRVKATNYSPIGRGMYVNEERQNYIPKSITYTFTANYKQFGKHYFLSSVIYQRNHEWVHKKSQKKRSETISAEILVTEIITDKPVVINARAYYEELKFDKAFWEKFNFMVDEKKK